MVHPCGSGAFGYFETTADVSDLTKVGHSNIALTVPFLR
jgi:catalase